MSLSLRSLSPSTLFFSIALTLSQISTAQPQPALPHTLLWRISGKGLQKPSYLFGTMHLNDKRLFRFDDSVFQAIEKTEGLAIEVNPDEMAAYFVNKLFDQLEHGKKLQDLLDKEYFNRHRAALAKKFNKSAEDISASDVIKEKHKWMSEYMEKGEMPTFMDAYLYNIARRQGKWLGGIEDINDQAGLMDDLIDQSDISYLLETDSTTGQSANQGTLEKMISLYSNQDLEGIESFASGNSTADVKDKVLIRRNLKMARRIDSLTTLRTMFLAIGAAHLPGDSGVISLLRRKGFTVDPVLSNKKIAASDYTFKEVHIPWVPVKGEQGYYSVEMPANPATVKLYGMIEMKFLMDLFNMSGFCTAAVINSSHIHDMDSLLNTTASKMFQGENARAVRSLENNGIPGKEYIHTTKGSNLRVQLFSDDKMVYMVILSSVKKEVLTSTDADKFFQSFTINHVKEDTSNTTVSFADSIMGVSILTHAPLTYNEKLSTNKEADWKISCFTGIDRATGSVVMLFSKELKAGYHIPDKNKIDDNFYEVMKTQYSDLKKDSTTVDSIKMIKLVGKNIRQPEIFSFASSIVKNGRQILFMVISDSPSLISPAIQQVIHSFHFIPHPSIPWKQYGSTDNTFSFYGPSPARENFYGSPKKLQWVSYDTTTATSFVVTPDTLGKYTWYRSDSFFWKARMGGDTTKDRLVEIKDVANGNVPGKEYIIKTSNDGVSYSRTRLLPVGDKVYRLFTAGEKDFLYSEKVNKFFNEFRISGGLVPSQATLSKAAPLLQDLGSTDSATRRDAYNALNSAPFVKKDAALLKDALFKLYQSPYDSTRGTTINYTIARKLALLNDSSSVTYVLAAYPSLVNDKRMLQNTAFSLLAHQHTTYSYTALAKLMQQGPLAERLGFTEFYRLKDSLALTTILFPSFQSWAMDTTQAPGMANLILTLVDSGYLSKDSLVPSATAFITAAAKLLPGLKTQDEYDNYNLSSLIRLVGRFHTSASYSLLKNYLSIKNKNLLQEVVDQLLKGGQTVPAAVLNRLAADPAYRSDLYTHLKDQKKTALFPPAYLTQPRFAESSIYGAGDDDDYGVIQKVEFLSKRTAAYKGKNYTWYLYKVNCSTEEGTHYYLGIAGGYDPAGAGVQPKKDLAGIYWAEDFDNNKIGQLFKAYLENMD